MPSKFQPSGIGYNGQTGAKATYNEASGTWTDTNGVSIRDDAITGTPGSGGAAASPSSSAGSAAASTPAGAAVGGGAGGALGANVTPSVTGLATAAGGLESGQQSGAGVQEMPAPGGLKQGLGQRIPPSIMALLAAGSY